MLGFTSNISSPLPSVISNINEDVLRVSKYLTTVPGGSFSKSSEETSLLVNLRYKNKWVSESTKFYIHSKAVKVTRKFVLKSFSYSEISFFFKYFFFRMMLVFN